MIVSNLAKVALLNQSNIYDYGAKLKNINKKPN
jgi:hypothetical protein